jgi:hypothetical protein
VVNEGLIDGRNEDDNNDDNSQIDEDEDDQKITLDELLDHLVLDSKPDDIIEEEIAAENVEMALQSGGETNMTISDDFAGCTTFVEDGARATKDKIGYVSRDEALNIASKESAIPVNDWGKAFMQKDGKDLM